MDMEEGGAEETLSSPTTSPSPPSRQSFFDRERHVTYLEMMYRMLPYHYQSQEINRLTLAYFVISGLDILNAIDRLFWVLEKRMNRKFGGGRPPTGTPSLPWSCAVVIVSLLAGASVVHNIYKPNLTLPPIEAVDGEKMKDSSKE